MGKLTVSIAIFNSYVSLPEGVYIIYISYIYIYITDFLINQSTNQTVPKNRACRILLVQIFASPRWADPIFWRLQEHFSNAKLDIGEKPSPWQPGKT